MPIWKYTNEPHKEVSKEDLEMALDSIQAACFKCGKDLHTDECPISQARAAVRELLDS